MKNPEFKRIILIIPVILNTAIFIILSILHFYWTFGGSLWYDEVLPTNSKGSNKMNPGTTASLIIAFGFLFFALMMAGNLGLFDRYIKRRYLRYGVLTIAIIFLARAIGDFRFVGFFKTVKFTKFGINDTHFFSPLCLFISLLSVVIFIYGKNEPQE